MGLSQYQIELAQVIKVGGDINEFKKRWHKRACSSYRKNVKTEKDIHAFRSGDFKI